TPQQRVTRLGHFLNQWGPEAQAVVDASRPITKEDEKLTIVGTAPSNPDQSKLSKVESGEKHEKDERRGTIADSKKHSAERRKSSVQKISSKTSATELPDKRRASVSSAQRSKRSSQTSSGMVVKEGSAIGDNQILEETASQIEKENESAGTEPPAASPKQSKGFAPSPVTSAQVSAKPSNSSKTSKGSGATTEAAEPSSPTPGPEEVPAEASAPPSPTDE
ncbi:hypothetical protein AMK59_2493, partial [Oryctes borbonicus]